MLCTTHELRTKNANDLDFYQALTCGDAGSLLLLKHSVWLAAEEAAYEANTTVNLLDLIEV